MRRRQLSLPSTVTVPEHLARFRYEDWADEGQVPPPWWDGKAGWPGWHYLRARIDHLRACQTYQREHGMTAQQWDQARGACGPDCRRDDPHWHG